MFTDFCIPCISAFVFCKRREKEMTEGGGRFKNSRKRKPQIGWKRRRGQWKCREGQVRHPEMVQTYCRDQSNARSLPRRPRRSDHRS